MLSVGSIVKLKNLCFDNRQADHAFKVGRPCVFIGEDENNMYFLPLTSNHHEVDKIEPDKYNDLKKPSSINIRQLIIKPIAYYNERGVVAEKHIIRAFEDIKKYYGIRPCKDADILIPIVDKYLQEHQRIVYKDADKKEKKIINQ